MAQEWNRRIGAELGLDERYLASVRPSSRPEGAGRTLVAHPNLNSIRRFKLVWPFLFRHSRLYFGTLRHLSSLPRKSFSLLHPRFEIGCKWVPYPNTP